MQGKLVTIFGGGGFVGRYVAGELLSQGARLRIAQRNPQGAMHIKPLGNLGQVQLIAADVRNPDSAARAVTGTDIVVNLVGSFGDMEAVQHKGAANIARAARKAGCGQLLHMSAIGANPNSASRYGRSKAAGEAAVRKAFKGATILRPSIIFGREDRFINRFAGMIRMMPIVPVIGAETKFQPVFVGDVAKVVASCLAEGRRHANKTYELGGPQVLSMLELNQWIANITGRDPMFVPMPAFAAKMLAMMTGWLPGAPITLDQYRMLGSDNVVTGENGLDAAGIAATSLDAAAHDWLDIYRKHGRFGDKALLETKRA
ncbi:MAG: complex I NDUFA9 subunit family protein [Sphingorhabdus sp.]